MALQELEGPEWRGSRRCRLGGPTPLLSVVVPETYLVTDNDGSTRSFCDQIRTEYGVTMTHLNPSCRRINRGAHARAAPRRVSRISGSLSFEMQDVTAIAAAAHAKGAIVLMG